MSFEEMQTMFNNVTRERYDYMSKVIETLIDAIDDHEKVIREQAKQIEKLTEQMNKLLEKA